MAFKKIFLFWLIITAVFAGLFYLVRSLFPTHPLWPWGVPYLYIGVLILFAIYVLKGKKE